MNIQIEILSYAWELRTELGLIAGPSAHQALNIPFPELDFDEKVSGIRTAIEEGLVRFRKQRANEATAPVNTDYRNDLLKALSVQCGPNEWALLELTKKGGEVWERQVKPDWPGFLTEGEPVIYQGKVWVDLQAGCEQTVERALLSLSKCFDSSVPNASFGRSLDSWSPVYWKQYHRGFEAWLNTQISASSAGGDAALHGISLANEEAGATLSVLTREWRSGLWSFAR